MPRGLPRHPLVWAAAALGLLGLLSLLPAGDSPLAGLALMRLGLALVAIIALVVGALPHLRRLPGAGGASDRRLRCEEVLALDARHKVALVSVDGRELLLGLQNDGTALLADLGATASRGAGHRDPDAERSFQRLLADRQAS